MFNSLIDTSFSSAQLNLLLCALLLLLLSLFFYQKGKIRLALALLFIGALALRIFMILLDPFLNDWDERYHALVAKNMITHPFTPMLWANPVLEYNYQAWCCNHIWLHKQPFFLWQMALSMKLFGVSEWAMRLPSALMSALQVLILYRIGRNFGHRTLGYLAGFLFALSYFQLEQTSGFMGREHNDIAFVFYLTAGFWALSEYLNNGKKTFLLLVGIFTGIAILNKWVVGLLLFGAWGVALLLNSRERKKLSRYGETLLAFGVTLAVILPWQIYIFIRFPQEASFVYGFQGKHLLESFDNHSGGPFFYFEHNNLIYGDWSWLMILPGLYFFYRLVPKSFFKTICLSALVLVYLVFSLAANKSITYAFFINFIIFFALAAFILGVAGLVKKGVGDRFLKYRPIAFFFLVTMVGFLTLQHWKIEAIHTRGEGVVPRDRKIHNTKIYRQLDELVPPDYILFNCWEAQEAMFYTDRTCYFWLGPEEYEKLKARGVKMAAFKDHKYLIPGYMKEDPEVLIIDREIILE